MIKAQITPNSDGCSCLRMVYYFRGGQNLTSAQRNSPKSSCMLNEYRYILVIWTTKPQTSRWIHIQMLCFCDCVCKCICIVQNDLYILSVKVLQDTVLFEKIQYYFLRDIFRFCKYSTASWVKDWLNNKLTWI